MNHSDPIHLTNFFLNTFLSHDIFFRSFGSLLKYLIATKLNFEIHLEFSKIHMEKVFYDIKEIGVVIVHVENFSYVAGYWVLGIEINWKLNFENVATFHSIFF